MLEAAPEPADRAGGSPRWLEFGALLLVAAIALKTTHGLLGTFDVGLDDETVYLDGARYLHVHNLPIAESSPLYPAWYRLLSVFQPDRLRLYFLNWYLLTAALPIVLHALARRSGAPVGAAAALAVTWAMSSAAMTWPFVTKFAALLLAAGALATTFVTDTRFALAIASATLSLTAYARAELSVFAHGFAGLVALHGASTAIRRRSRIDVRRGLFSAVFALAVAAGLRLHFGDTGTGNRAFFAFAQHYTLNVVEDRHLTIDPWTNWHIVSREAFPTATTVGDAWKENRAAFLWHVGRNLTTLPRTLTELFRPLPWVPGPYRDLVTLAFDGALFGGLAGFVLRRRLSPPLRNWLPILGVVLVSTAASILVVYPREHYVLPLSFLAIAAIASGAPRLARAGAILGARIPARLRVHVESGAILRGARGAMLAGLALFFVAIPTAPAPPTWARQNVLTIDKLRELGLARDRTLHILESDYSRGLYADYDYVRVAVWERDKATPFWTFIQARGVNVVALDDRLRNDTRFVDDPDFKAFAANEPGQVEDFVRFPIEGTGAVLMVRRGLLPNGAR